MEPEGEVVGNGRKWSRTLRRGANIWISGRRGWERVEFESLRPRVRELGNVEQSIIDSLNGMEWKIGDSTFSRRVREQEADAIGTGDPHARYVASIARPRPSCQASSSDVVEGFGGENGENVGLNEGSEEGEGGLKGGVARGDEGVVWFRLALAIVYARWNEGGHEEGTSLSDVRGAGTGLQASDEDNRGGGDMVIVFEYRRRGAGRETREKVLTW
ncbi:hypothetical protein EDB86DRAFT_2836371 [Lactarius hatsudake]|nr:hypothetical protein EDB86DRAFT_2836371 [Lactarius hatsudake]